MRSAARWLWGLLAVGLVVVVIVLIVQAKNRSEAQREAELAADKAIVEGAVRDGVFDCFVVMSSGKSADAAIATNKRFPCNAVPLDGEFHTVITLKGVLFEAARRHNITLTCTDGSLFNAGSSNTTPDDAIDDLHAVVGGGVAGEQVGGSPPSLNCQVVEIDDIIRTVRIDRVLDPQHRFER